MNDQPRAFTAEEMRTRFLDHIRTMTTYWADLPDHSPREKCDGLAFSILVMLDGASMSLPGMDIVMRPHESDKAFCISEGENWVEDGQVINDCQLHELFYSPNDPPLETVAAVVGMVRSESDQPQPAKQQAPQAQPGDHQQIKEGGTCPHCGYRHPPDGICI